MILSKEDTFARIQSVDFPKEQYIKEEYDKNQIVLHHTASGRGVNGDFKYWIDTPQRIATFCIIDYKGIIYQCFSSKYYAYHLGTGKSDFTQFGLSYQNLNKTTIGIELDAWGTLYEENGKFYHWAGREVSKEKVISYDKPFGVFPDTSFFESKGVVGEPVYHYERYTEEQLESLKGLCFYFYQKYDIPITYNSKMWNVCKEALAGEPGIWTHRSYRKYGKSDCHPQPSLIDALVELNNTQ